VVCVAAKAGKDEASAKEAAAENVSVTLA